jgi:hypothetical protein
VKIASLDRESHQGSAGKFHAVRHGAALPALRDEPHATALHFCAESRLGTVERKPVRRAGNAARPVPVPGARLRRGCFPPPASRLCYPRLSRKNPANSAPHSSASTPATTSGR